MKKIIILLLSLIMLTSCGSYSLNKSAGSAKLSTSLTIDPPENLSSSLAVGEKITGNASGTFLFGMFKLSGDNKYADDIYSGIGTLTNIKAAAAYNALSSSGADIIVNPQYVVEKKVSLLYLTTTYNVTVTGRAGNITVK